MDQVKEIKLMPPQDNGGTVTAGIHGDFTLGIFYNSYDKMYHICEYIPYQRPPRISLCDIERHWTATGDTERALQKLCPNCKEKCPS